LYQLNAQGPSRACNEGKEKQEKEEVHCQMGELTSWAWPSGREQNITPVTCPPTSFKSNFHHFKSTSHHFPSTFHYFKSNCYHFNQLSNTEGEHLVLSTALTCTTIRARKHKTRA